MSNIHTITSTNNKSSQNDWKKTTGHKLQQDNKLDEQDCENKTKPSININTVIPQKLNNNDVCLLYEQFLEDLEDEDRDMYIDKLRKEKITGRTLILACENAKVMEEVIKTLGFPLDYKLRFDDMMKRIKKRQKELKQENDNEQATPRSSIDETNAPKEYGQSISKAECVIGAMHNNAQSQKISTGCTYYGKEKRNSP